MVTPAWAIPRVELVHLTQDRPVVSLSVMTTQTRKGIAWGVVSGIATITGLLTDVPELIKENSSSIPLWLRNPDVIWVLSIGSAYALLLLIVWRMDRHRGKDGWVRDTYEKLEALGGYMQTLAKKYKLTKINDLSNLDKGAAQGFVDECRNGMPRFIGQRFGAKERQAFTKTLQSVTSKDPRAAAGQTALAIGKWATDLFASELRTLMLRSSAYLRLDLDENFNDPSD